MWYKVQIFVSENKITFVHVRQVGFLRKNLFFSETTRLECNKIKLHFYEMLTRQHQLCHSFLRDFFSNFIKSLFGLKKCPQPQNFNSSFLLKRFCWRIVWNVVAGKTVRIPDIFLRSPLLYSALFQNWQTKSKILKFKRCLKDLTLYLTVTTVDKSVIVWPLKQFLIHLQYRQSICLCFFQLSSKDQSIPKTIFFNGTFG